MLMGMAKLVVMVTMLKLMIAMKVLATTRITLVS